MLLGFQTIRNDDLNDYLFLGIQVEMATRIGGNRGYSARYHSLEFPAAIDGKNIF